MYACMSLLEIMIKFAELKTRIEWVLFYTECPNNALSEYIFLVVKVK